MGTVWRFTNFPRMFEIWPEDVNLTTQSFHQTRARIPSIFSLLPDPDQNREDASFISVVARGVYIPLSRPIQICPLPYQKFEKNARDPADPAELWIQDPSGFFADFHGVPTISSKTFPVI